MTTSDDRYAIAQLQVGYAWAIDGRQWSLLEEVFADPVDVGYAVDFRSGDRQRCIDDFRVFHEVYDSTHHVVSNQHVELRSDDTAFMRAYAIGTLVKQGLPGGDRFTAGAYYEDDVVRTPAGWRIAKRAMIVSWTDGNLDVVKVGRAALRAAATTDEHGKAQR